MKLNSMKKSYRISLAFTFVFALSALQAGFTQEVFKASDLLSVERAGLYDLSPDGSEIIYVVATPRGQRRSGQCTPEVLSDEPGQQGKPGAF